MVIYFLSNFIMNVYISDNKLVYLISMSSLLEYITTLPLLFTHLGLFGKNSFIDFTRALRFIMVSKIDKVLARHTVEWTRSLFRLIFTLVANLLISSAALYLVESTGDIPEGTKVFHFYDWVYFMLVTLTVVGFGDVYPVKFFGQLIVVVSILLLLIKIPSDFSNFQKAQNLRSEYSSNSYNKKKEKTDHITVLGNYNMDALKT
jgi:hypothetical protein